MSNPFLTVHPEVAAAIAEKRPVVALESTIISHGMPYPQNVDTAFWVEACIRERGAVPATIAIMDGKLKAGLHAEEIEQLGKAGLSVTKASRRDLPFLIQRKALGATTVAATMIIAEMAGIYIFATGGIGGVHRGAADTFDISADLQELANTSVAVVSAGAKSILDLPLTMEYLETFGVPVIGYQTDAFPAFYARESGLFVDYRLDSAADIAEALQTKWAMGLTGGALVANPVPAEHALDISYLREITDQALALAQTEGVTGKHLTPFLLASIKDLSKGASLVSNIELVMNNARLAADIAVAMAN